MGHDSDEARKRFDHRAGFQGQGQYSEPGWNFPATPTIFAIRTDRWKYVHTSGVWDRNGFYDLQTDPIERHNLIDVPAFQEQIQALRKELFDEMGASGGLQIPILPPAGEVLDDRKLGR